VLSILSVGRGLSPKKVPPLLLHPPTFFFFSTKPKLKKKRPADARFGDFVFALPRRGL